MYNCDGNSSTLTLSSEHTEESVQKNRRQLQEQIQVKNDSLSIIFQMIYKLEYLSNKWWTGQDWSGLSSLQLWCCHSKLTISFIIKDLETECQDVRRVASSIYNTCNIMYRCSFVFRELSLSFFSILTLQSWLNNIFHFRGSWNGVRSPLILSALKTSSI